MSTRVEIEEIESTKSEKLLAVVLAVFLLIGGAWAYVKIDDYTRGWVATPSISPSDRAAIDRLVEARARYSRAGGERRRALQDLELRREAYRTALDADRPAERLEREYVAAQRRHRAARREQEAALDAVVAAKPAADATSRREAARFEREHRREALLAFALRFLLVTASLAAAYWLLDRLRRSRSRWLPLAFAAVGYATVLSLVLAGDYVTDYVDPLDLGPLVLSLVGIAATLAAFWALQRYLASRIPLRRARKGECPFCGYPVRGAGPHCEGCGRQVVAPCARCEAPRRVGVAHCAACGG